MYCIDCGTQNLDTTRYCKSCGANLEALRMALTQPVTGESGSLVGPRHVTPVLVLSTLLGICGLGAVFAFIAALAEILGPAIGKGIIPIALLLGLGGIAGVTLMVTHMLRMLKTSGPGRAAHTGPLPQQQGLPTGQGRVLPSARFAEHVPGSVVEHTTSRLPDYAAPRHEERER